MKKVFVLLITVLFLLGCSAPEDQMERALSMRQSILKARECRFTVTVTADYSDAIYSFKMYCVSDASGKMEFEVISPDSISGVSGMISQTQSNISFDDQILAFSPLADGYISPVSAPWVFMRALRSGYLRSCGTSGKDFIVIIDDSYQEESLQVDICIDRQNIPITAEFLWKGRRILTLALEDFTFV